MVLVRAPTRAVHRIATLCNGTHPELQSLKPTERVFVQTLSPPALPGKNPILAATSGIAASAGEDGRLTLLVFRLVDLTLCVALIQDLQR